MGIFDDIAWGNNPKEQFNHLFVIFYAGYLVALWPGAALAQRIGHKLFINISLLLWALLLGMHPLAKTGQHLMILRFFLGMVSTEKHPVPIVHSQEPIDRISDRTVCDRPPPGLLPSQEITLGAAAMVGFRQSR